MDDLRVIAYIKPGTEKEMLLSEAVKLDEPEGTVLIFVTATLLQKIIKREV